MQPRLETLPAKQFIGKRLNMSFAHNPTFELWHSFMPKRKAIPNQVDMQLYSIEVYPTGFYDKFNPETTFENGTWWKYSNRDRFLKIWEPLPYPPRLYAIFIHKVNKSDSRATSGATIVQVYCLYLL